MASPQPAPAAGSSSGQVGPLLSLTLDSIAPLRHREKNAVVTAASAVECMRYPLSQTGAPLPALLPSLLTHVQTLADELADKRAEKDTLQRSLYLLDSAIRPQLEGGDLARWVNAMGGGGEGVPSTEVDAKGKGREESPANEGWMSKAATRQGASEEELVLVLTLLRKHTPWNGFDDVPWAELAWSTSLKFAKSLSSIIRYAARLDSRNKPLKPRPPDNEVERRLRAVIFKASTLCHLQPRALT